MEPLCNIMRKKKKIISLEKFLMQENETDNVAKPRSQSKKLDKNLTDTSVDGSSDSMYRPMKFNDRENTMLSLFDEKQTDIKGIDLNEAIRLFLRNIRLPEIKSPPMPRYVLEKIVRPQSRILVVTEKQKVAQALAKALAGKNYKVIRRNNIPIYSLRYRSFFVTIVPLKGHLLEYDTAKQYRSWSSIDPVEIIKNERILTIKPRFPRLVTLLRELARKHDVLIIATDADEEGENIGWEASEIISQVKKMPVYRMWFLSTQTSELLKAFNSPTTPIISWALAPEARKIIDAFSGFSSTRELTLAGRSAGGALSLLLRNSILSLGRVQSPTLYLLYLRERYIRNFKPKPYWSISAIFTRNGYKFQATHKDSPFYDENKAKYVYEKTQRAKTARILRVEQSKEKKFPPPPLDTNKALIMLNKILSLPSNKAMQILEDLYLEGLITYPRTDTDKYPSNYDHTKNLKTLIKHPKLGSIARKILSQGAKLRRNGRKLVGDHLPITPIDVPRPNTKLSQLHLKVYELIVRRYLALFMETAELNHIKAIIDVNGEIFQATSTTILREGFWQVYPFGRPKEKPLNLREGDILDIDRINIEKKMTKPPSRLTEAELLKLMEKLGLGTKATRPEHIQKLIARGYVVRRGKKLFVTELGYRIAEFLEKLWPEFLQPYFCAYILSLLRQVMNQEIDHKEAIKKARMKFLELFLRLRRARKDLKKVLANIAEIEIPQTIRKKRRSKGRKKR